MKDEELFAVWTEAQGDTRGLIRGLRAIAAAERERCRKVLKDLGMGMMSADRVPAALVVMECAAAIRQV